MRRPARRSALRRRYSRGENLSSGKIQVLLFPRDSWSIEDALVWASVNGFNASEYDVAENYIRVLPAGKHKKARRAKTIPYGTNGVRAVVEWR